MGVVTERNGLEGRTEMTGEEFYRRVLNLEPLWTVKAVVIHDESNRVDVDLQWIGEEELICPVCGVPVQLSEYKETVAWRHLDTCSMRTCLRATLPNVTCPKHGKQTLRPPWAGQCLGFTAAFQQWCVRLAKELGGVKAAALVARVSAADVRLMLRAEQQRRAAATIDTTLEPFVEAPEKTDRRPQMRQLSLFAQRDMPLINEGIQALQKLDFDRAIELFEKHGGLFPKGCDVASKTALATFLRDGLRRAPSEGRERLIHLCGLWHALEDHLLTIGAAQEPAVHKMKPAFFARILQEGEQSGLSDIAFLSDDVPMGYVFLQAGQPDAAVQSLQTCILQAPGNARVYGYLGDAYLLRGDSRIARQSYREACFIDPAGIDWQHLKDDELRELKEELLLEYGFDGRLAVQWLPCHARMDGLFERKVMRLHAGAKDVVADYLAVQKSWRKKPDPLVGAKLFVRGMVLCENEEILKFIKKIDLIQVRREMRRINPDLFSEFLEKIIGGKVAKR